MKRLIINADDFGLSRSVNEGILKAYTDGLVSSVSIMPCSDAFDDALRIVKNYSIKNIGIHLTLNEELPLSSSNLIPDLVNKHAMFNNRYQLISKLILKPFTSSLKQQITTELTAQIEKVLDNNIVPSHVDGHCHVHIYPHIADIVSELLIKYQIDMVRLPYESFKIFNPQKPQKLLNKAVINYFASNARRVFKKNNIKFPDKFLGISYGGALTYPALKKMIGLAKVNQITEIMVHPGYFSKMELQKYSDWHYSWEAELSALVKHSKNEIKDVEFLGFSHIK